MSVTNGIEILSLHEWGAVLSTRERGREAADKLQDGLKEHSVVISFDGVEVATPSFLDEVLTRLRSTLQANEQAMALARGMNNDVRESLDLVLKHRNMMLGELDRDQIHLLGGKKQLEETLAAAMKRGSFKATELADELELKLPNLHQRLKALHEAGVVSRESDETAERGRRHLYKALDPREITSICA